MRTREFIRTLDSCPGRRARERRAIKRSARRAARRAARRIVNTND